MKSAADSDSDSNSSIFVTQRLLLQLHLIILASYFWTFESFIVKLVKSF